MTEKAEILAPFDRGHLHAVQLLRGAEMMKLALG